MDQNVLFVYNEEEDGKTPKQSPGSNQTWPMDKIRKSRFETPKRNYSISHSKSLLLQCLRDSKTDPLPCRRRFLASSCSEEGILMDGVLVTSATTTAKKKVASNSPSSLFGRSSTRSSTMFSSPRSESGRKQETTRSSQQTSAGKENSPSSKLETPKDTTRSSQQSSSGKGKNVETSPSTKLETPKTAAKASKLKATAEPFTFTPRSRQEPVSPFPYGNLHARYPYLRPPLLHLPPHNIARLPNPTSYQMHHDFNQSPFRNDLRISLLPTKPPSSSYTNTNTSEPLVQTHDSKPDSSSPSVDGLDTVTQNLDQLLPSVDEFDKMLQTQDLLSPSSDGVETIMRTMKEDWSPSDDKDLETFTEAQTEFTRSHDRILPDDAFQVYKYRKRLPIFTQLHQLPPPPEKKKKEEEDQ